MIPTPRPDPPLPAPRPVFSERARPGLRFRETMEGWFAWDGDGADVSGDGRLRISFDLTVLADDVEQFIGGIQHAARLVGTVTAPKLSPHPMAVSDGAFQLFYVDADEVETRYMHYRLSVTSGDGVVCRIDGKKLIRNESWRRLWPALTTLYVTIQEETGDKRHGHGVLHLSAPAFLRSLATVRASNTSGVLEGIDVKARLVGFFMDMARSMYGGITARPVLATLDAPVRARTRAVCRPMSYTVQTSDTTRVHLTRYQGGGRGPVILSPGFSVTADSFAADTVRENLVNFLCHRDYDVWLFDYRASSGFPAAGTRFSIDDIASRDYPAAVEKVLEVTHAGDVQIIAHCVGSLSLLMSLALGLLHARDRPGAGGPGARPNNLVRSVICSQLGLHPIAPRASEVKAALAVASALRHLGVRTISAHYDPYRVMHRMTDKLLSLYPTAERCNNPACRRILLLFGESFRHAQLNTATHDAIDQWFGTTSVPALSHLSLMLRARRAVDKDGRDVYLPHLDRLALPIAFMHGLCNLEFLPRSTLRTYRQLARRNGRGWYVRKRFPDYGHMDCFIGKNADRDIFPFIASELEEGPRRRG